MEVAATESSHDGEAADAPLPPPIVRLMIWPDDGTSFFVQLHFIWDTEHDTLIRKIYNHRMGRRLQQMLEDYRHLTNRTNRALSRLSKYTGGSTTLMNTKARMLKLLNREATLVEKFKYTHTLKENKARFANQQSQDHYDSTDSSVASVIDLDAVWHETVSAPYKNHVYGMGSFFASSLRTSTLRPSSSSATSRAVKPKEGVDLRLQVQELTHSLHHQT
ncbi:hypothetical protein Ahy_A07g032590 [Arachis hypogaea]|uniref:Uncharacterized protein n=1 Tax=Arachis hypogaea TaxID=3818 RepID=A0A445C745_ARAHY|nr:hypothetical protein Ahy_A07g032590 [Arachis hypogaea]